MFDVSTNAWTLGAWRECEHGNARNYAAMLETSGPGAVAGIVRSAAWAGHLMEDRENSSEWFGTLDIYNDAGDIIQDYVFPSEESWQWWCAAAEMRPTDRGCDACDVR